MQRSAGGSMMQAVGRAVGAGNAAGVKEVLSTAAAAAAGGAKPPAARRAVTVAATSSSPSSPTFAAAGWGSFPCLCDGEEWEAVGGIGGEEEEEEGLEDAFGHSDRLVFGQAPSKEEAEEALSTLQQIFVPLTFSHVIEDGCSPLDKNAVERVMIATDTTQSGFSTESEADWIEPAVHMYRTQTFHSQERGRVIDAFRLLQINPSIQRMVVSLSSDKAVWDAVMNNEVVQELKKSFYEDENPKPQSSEEDPDSATGILKWILDNTKAKVVGFFDLITKLVNELFSSQEKDGNKDEFNVAVTSSFLLSVAVLIIVVVARFNKN